MAMGFIVASCRSIDITIVSPHHLALEVVYQLCFHCAESRKVTSHEKREIRRWSLKQSQLQVCG